MERTTLVLNAGSSSLKFAVARGRTIFARGSIDHFGRQAVIAKQLNGRHQHLVAVIPDLRAALKAIRAILVKPRVTPNAVAHRIVHGGDRYSRPTRLSPAVIRNLRTFVELAPLHQQANLLGVAFAKRAWPRADEWGVFDTAVYHDLPDATRTYAIPWKVARQLHIVKYGFHGTSHAWALQRAASRLRRPLRSFSAVTVHLGAGASMTVWQRGRPMDTTMGFTPLAGLVMATRSGDIDPAVPLFLQEKLGWSAGRVRHILEHESGLKGLCGLEDMRDILDAAGHPAHGWPRHRRSFAVRARSKQALDIFTYHLRRMLAGYLGLLEQKDAVVFTGPIGENRFIQQRVLHALPAARGVPHLTVPADEEQAILGILHT